MTLTSTDVASPASVQAAESFSASTVSKQLLESLPNTDGTLKRASGSSHSLDTRQEVAANSVAEMPRWAPLAVPGDERWAGNFVLNGMDGAVNAVAADGNGNIYAGGDFTTAGNVVANHIARWNGSGWSALGSGLSGCPSNSPCVKVLAVDRNENIYVGGAFTTAGGVSANNIAKWNGNTWFALGSAWSVPISALAVDGNGNVYAAGSIFIAHNYPPYWACSIGKWDGSAWTMLINVLLGCEVYTLAVDGSGNLYAGGSFSTIGGVSAKNIAKWNGSGWSALESGLNQEVDALTGDGSGNLYAGGAFTETGDGSTVLNRIAKWNGSNWEALGGGIPGGGWPYVVALAVDGSNVYAGGSFATAGGVSANSIAKWNGSTWEALGSGLDKFVSALVVKNSNVYAGGWFSAAGAVSANHIAKWNGSSWATLGSDTSVNSSVSALALDGSGNVYVGGGFTKAGDIGAKSIAKWNGNTWSALESGLENGVSALAADRDSNIYASTFSTTTNGSTVILLSPIIVKWNGSRWERLGSELSDLLQVNALTVDNSENLYAGGQPATHDGVSRIFKWNGSNWEALGSVGSGTAGVVRALAVDSSGAVYAGGEFGVARWNGSSWEALGSGMNGPVHALATDNSGNVYVAGRFTTVGNVSANYVARWNGSWSALGSGLSGVQPECGISADALAVDQSGNVYVGGCFATAGEVATNYVARWNGSSWEAIGSGMNKPVRALAVDSSGNVYVGGSFTVAGGKASAYIAKWTLVHHIFFPLIAR